MNFSNGILDGIGDLVDEWLELSFSATMPLYQHKTAALQLCTRPSIPSATGFLEKAYRRINNNWASSDYRNTRPPSRENWRFEQRSDISAENTSPEVRLERAIIQASDAHWANQVPTSSGLVGPSADKVRNIDLVQRGDSGNYVLIELKVASNNPLFAAIEILLYGLLLAWSRNNAQKLCYGQSAQPVLLARRITLCVLAPREYYSGMDLTLLGQSINEGLQTNEALLGLPCSFEFTQFSSTFEQKDSPAELFEEALQREIIWG